MTCHLIDMVIVFNIESVEYDVIRLTGLSPELFH